MSLSTARKGPGRIPGKEDILAQLEAQRAKQAEQLKVEAHARQELEDMLLRIERHFKVPWIAVTVAVALYVLVLLGTADFHAVGCPAGSLSGVHGLCQKLSRTCLQDCSLPAALRHCPALQLSSCIDELSMLMPFE